MLPWEEELDEPLKTFLLRCACGPPSIFYDSQTRLCSMNGLCTAILKSKNLPFLPHWEQKGISKMSLLVSRLPGQLSPEPHCTVDSTVCCVSALFEIKTSEQHGCCHVQRCKMIKLNTATSPSHEKILSLCPRMFWKVTGGVNSGSLGSEVPQAWQDMGCSFMLHRSSTGSIFCLLRKPANQTGCKSEAPFVCAVL